MFLLHNMVDVASLSEQEIIAKYLDKDLTSNGLTIAFNMAASIDGVTTIKQELGGIANERGLSNPLDKQLMHILRSKADCVLNGAQTLRLSGASSNINQYSKLTELRKQAGKSENPLAAVLTTNAAFSEDVLQSTFFKDNSFQSILFVLDTAPRANIEKVKIASQSKKLDVIALEDKPDTIKELVRILEQDYRVGVLLIEGGSAINGSFINNRLGNDFFITTSPRIAIASPSSKAVVTGPETLLKDDLRDVKLQSAYYNEDVGSIFQHWKIM